jgi:hypothetical protein
MMLLFGVLVAKIIIATKAPINFVEGFAVHQNVMKEQQ